ncbi:MAG: hypothetical protein K9G67_15065 [Bacteroidales bacterium]|nr:hypothetical protein [Bacteroidales bacterium]MCF8343999.1 hypothetical protein [Bacteroidales bacterium]MCF8350423.1 hypothetical protein [Bacteroidales bacterium]MCF8377674.1 hypothetical protein [Bacteroidales bacterium]MCF8401950.1 hypothetical protein [Bacteroidales bacterium]
MTPEQLQNRIAEIITDNSSGSTGVLNSVMDLVKDHAQDQGDFRMQLLVDKLNELFVERPNFLVLFHFLNELFLELEEKDIQRTKPEQQATFVNDFVWGYQARWNMNSKTIAETFRKEIDPGRKTFLLHSNSSLIKGIFKELSVQGIRCRVFQTLSSPAEEGKQQAEVLQESGHSVSFITESEVRKFIHEMDFFISGCDGLYRDFFVNKSGSMALALLFRHFGKKTFVATESRKYVDQEKISDKLLSKFRMEPPKNPAEIWDDPPKGIKVKNYYFEEIPLDLADGLFTEKGLVKPDQIVDLQKEFRISALFNFDNHIQT